MNSLQKCFKKENFEYSSMNNTSWVDNYFFKDFVMQSATEFLNILNQCSKDFSWFSFNNPKGSMHNIELFLIYLYSKVLQPTVILESGAGIGRATLPLAAFTDFMGCETRLLSASYPEMNDNLVEIKNKFKHVDIQKSKSNYLAELLDESERIVCVIDGPKPAVKDQASDWKELMKILLNKKTLAIFVHDCRRLVRPQNYLEALNFYSEFAFLDYQFSEISSDFMGRWYSLLGGTGSQKNVDENHIDRLMYNHISNTIYFLRDFQKALIQSS